MVRAIIVREGFLLMGETRRSPLSGGTYALAGSGKGTRGLGVGGS